MAAATFEAEEDGANCTLRVVRDGEGAVTGLSLLGLGSAADVSWLESGTEAATFVVTARPTGNPDIWAATLAPPDPAADARLRELNHRVLNSLAMLSSIIGLETRAIGDGDGRAALERVRSRLVAVSNLYRILSAADARPVIRADLYLKSVADAVAASVGLGERIAVEVRTARIELTTTQAAALGLITNEAMTNAYKHAFAGRGRGRIVVSLAEVGDDLVLAVTDDGNGMPQQARRGLGATLMGALATDLDGAVASASEAGGGTSLRVTFPRGL